MTDTCIIYDEATTKIANSLQTVDKISFDSSITDDEGLHDFVINTIKASNFSYKKMIIPCKLGSLSSAFDYMGINLGLHIRLTEELEEKRLISLIFISASTLEEILISQIEKTGYLLTTKGCRLVKRNGSKIKEAVQEAQFPTPTDLKSIIRQLVLNTPEDTLSRHSIANQWGAMKLNEITEVNALPLNSDVMKKRKWLYYKWLLMRNKDFEEKNTISNRTAPKLSGLTIVQKPDYTINSKGKRILLIDDEEDKGWSKVLKAIFFKDSFDFVKHDKDSSKFLSNARLKIASEDWDLILLDLRLKKEDHELDCLVDKFTGTQLLREIKDKVEHIEGNNGTQVIIFTASNKAWNMRTLLFKEEADGYYIKEAPDYNLGKSFTKENYINFKKQVETALSRDYLRWFYKEHENLKTFIFNIIKSISDSKEKKYYGTVITYLNQAYDVLKVNKANEPRFYEYAFLNYFSVLENITKHFYFYDKSSDEDYIERNNKRTKVIYYKGNTAYSAIDLVERGDKVINAKIKEVKEEKIKNTRSYLFRICALLLLEYYANPQEIRIFITLNELRNKEVAHGSTGNQRIKIGHLKELFKLIYLLITNKRHTNK